MNNILKKWYAHLVMMSVIGWKYKYIIKPLTYALYIIAYDGFNYDNFIKALHMNRKIVNVIIVIFSCLFISYWMGSEKNMNRIEFMQITISKTLGILDVTYKDKNVAELKLKNIFSSRCYKEYLIHKESKIIIPATVSDEDLDIMLESAEEFEIPYFIFFRMLQKESTFKWVKNGEILTSRAGAKGYAQVMPDTFSEYCKKLNIKPEINVKNNLRVGAKLLSDLYVMYNPKGDKTKYDTWKKPLMAYNAGVRNVSSGRAEKFIETQNYVASILYHKN